MAVRELSDDLGRAWRAWDIKPEAIHPQTKAEDYLADCYTVGWIVFERTTGEEKRRLCPFPIRWADQSDAELRALLSGAEVVPPHKLYAQRQAAGNVAAPHAAPHAAAHAVADRVADASPDITDLEVVRSFRYPGGRLWTVCVVMHPEEGGGPVLRFTAGMRWIDVETWPRDWADARDDALVDMLRRAAPRVDKTPVPGTPRRRWNDLPEQTAAR
jgi:hypothetical protein